MDFTYKTYITSSSPVFILTLICMDEVKVFFITMLIQDKCEKQRLFFGGSFYKPAVEIKCLSSDLLLSQLVQYKISPTTLI